MFRYEHAVYPFSEKRGTTLILKKKPPSMTHFRWSQPPGDSKWPFHPLVGGHLTIEKGHLTNPKRSQRIARLVFFHHPIFLSGRCWEQSSIRWSLRPGRVDTGATYNAPTCHQGIMKPTTAIYLGVDATTKIEGGSKQKKVNGWLNNFVVLRSLFFCLDWMLFLMNFEGPWNPLSFRHPAFGFPKRETLPWCLEKMAI